MGGLRIQAGPRPPVQCPVALPMAAPEAAAAERRVVQRAAGEDHQLALQRAGDRLWFVLPYLGPDSAGRMEVRADAGYGWRGVRIIDRGATWR